MSTDNGGHAFPLMGHGDNGSFVNEGMTLRDYFAAKAMAALVEKAVTPSLDKQSIAAGAYRIADAMLKARSEEEQ